MSGPDRPRPATGGDRARHRMNVVGRKVKRREQKATRLKHSPRRREMLRARLEAWSDLPLSMASLLFGMLAIVAITGRVAPAEQGLLTSLLTGLWCVFALHLIVELVLVTDRLRYLREHWVRVLILLLPLLGILRVARGFLIFRSLSATRLFFLGRRHSKTVMRALQRHHVGRVLVTSVFVVPIFAIVEWLAESGAPGSTIHTLGDSLWWSASTVTTIGGELYPVTALGRAVSILLMLYAIGIFGYVVSSVASALVDDQTRHPGASAHPRQIRMTLTEEEAAVLRSVAGQLTEDESSDDEEPPASGAAPRGRGHSGARSSSAAHHRPS